jgi:hypothetical protein
MPTPALRMLWTVLAVVGAAFLVIYGLFGNWGAGAESPMWQRWPVGLQRRDALAAVAVSGAQEEESTGGR